MIHLKGIDWQPMHALPPDRTDGRQVLLWNGQASVCVWMAADDSGAWVIDVGAAGGNRDVVDRPRWWADIIPPE